MIDNELKILITPNLKLHLEDKDLPFIEEMFSECYVTYFEGEKLVTLKPHPNSGDIAMQFSILTGSFYEITSWSYIKSIGVLL